MAALGDIGFVNKSNTREIRLDSRHYTTFYNKLPSNSSQNLVISLGQLSGSGSLERIAYLFTDDYTMNIVQRSVTSPTDGSVTFYNVLPGKYKVMIEGDAIDTDTKVSYQSVIYDNITVTEPLSMTSLLPICTEGTTYTASIIINGGVTPYSNLVSTNLPSGLSASLSGSVITISGTSTVSGENNFTLEITDNAGKTYTQSYDLYVYGSSEWTPAQLFAVSGTYGFWYDFTDISTLFTDSAGTIPIKNIGDKVAYVKDKSGNNNYVSYNTQTNEEYYPTVKIDNYGYTYFNSSSNYTLAGTLNNFTGNFDGNTSKTCIAITSNSNISVNNGTYSIMNLNVSQGLISDVPPVNFWCYASQRVAGKKAYKLIQGQSGNGNTNDASSFSVVGLSTDQYENGLVEWQKNSNTLSIYTDGVLSNSVVTATNANLQYATYNIMQGGSIITTTPAYAPLYHCILLNRVLTSSERTALTTWYSKFKGNAKVIYPSFSNALTQILTVNSAISSFTYAVDNGNSPSNFSIVSGALPTGLTMDSTGTITGTPTATGIYNYTVAFDDTKFGTVAIKQLTYVVNSIDYTLNSTGTSISDWTYNFNFIPNTTEALDNTSITYCAYHNSNISPMMYMNNTTSGNIYILNVKSDSNGVIKFGCDSTGIGYYFQIFNKNVNDTGLINCAAAGWTAFNSTSWVTNLGRNYGFIDFEDVSVYIDFSTPSSTNIYINGQEVIKGASLTSSGTYVGIGAQTWITENPFPSGFLGFNIVS